MNLCACGCGQPTTIIKMTNKKMGRVRGQANRFALGHTPRRLTGRGYFIRYAGGAYLFEHRIIAERALGHPLPVKAQVHHVDGDKRNNAATNLVICQDMAYHKLLHFRADLILAGANPNTERICKACGEIKLIEAFTIDRRSLSSGRHWNCRDCKRVYDATFKVRRLELAS